VSLSDARARPAARGLPAIRPAAELPEPSPLEALPADARDHGLTVAWAEADPGRDLRVPALPLPAAAAERLPLPEEPDGSLADTVDVAARVSDAQVRALRARRVT